MRCRPHACFVTPTPTKGGAVALVLSPSGSGRQARCRDRTSRFVTNAIVPPPTGGMIATDGVATRRPPPSRRDRNATFPITRTKSTARSNSRLAVSTPRPSVRRRSGGAGQGRLVSLVRRSLTERSRSSRVACSTEVIPTLRLIQALISRWVLPSRRVRSATSRWRSFRSLARCSNAGVRCGRGSGSGSAARLAAVALLCWVAGGAGGPKRVSLRGHVRAQRLERGGLTALALERVGPVELARVLIVGSSQRVAQLLLDGRGTHSAPS